MKQQWIERPEAGGVTALLLIRTFALLCGRTAARLVLIPITLYYLVRRKPERRASRAYLRRILGREPTLEETARTAAWTRCEVRSPYGGRDVVASRRVADVRRSVVPSNEKEVELADGGTSWRTVHRTPKGPDKPVRTG